ncbi:hypothetical protein CHS0354_003007 [Potamilus streckersoni]|uniref:L-serine deaminase n=1 Tax=Potamilus streckersoni TaxID=2493646 RepID=A0AAE0SBC3_9BIVA|nr:hypothetical protein CHS0354_003007 [Potamilus streckersoni]
MAATFEDILQARDRLKGKILRTPLVQLNTKMDDNTKIYLKLENLQPIGSFKIRGAFNAIGDLEPETLKNGVYTASAGNFAQGLAWAASILGVTCDVLVPDYAPNTKLEAIERYGGKTHKITFNEWWKVICSHYYEGMAGMFIHPVSERAVIAGNGTVGMEIFEDLPEVDSVIVPYGGGGLTTGIATALKHLKPSCKIYASEVETAAPLAASLEAGKPVFCNFQPTFIDGIGGKSVLDEMWPFVSSLVAKSLVVSVQEVADAIKMLVERNHVVAEGAGAASVAAALSGAAGKGNIVCVVTGGNIDLSKLIPILEGNLP